tara:strand:+ start:239 stop:889 length:651 start_codon:yes stop_codon:yes gene_type:complete
MALGALATAALISAAAGGVATGIETLPTPAEKENKRKLKELQAREEAETLGLTSIEQQSLYNEGESLMRQRQQEAEAVQRQYMAQGTSSGQAFERALAKEESALSARQAMVQGVQEQDYIKQEEQRQEIEDRLAADEQRKKERRSKLAGFVKSTGQTGMKAYELDLDEQGQSATDAQTAELAQLLGMSEVEAAKLAGELGKNPDVAQMLAASIGGI